MLLFTFFCDIVLISNAYAISVPYVDPLNGCFSITANASVLRYFSQPRTKEVADKEEEGMRMCQLQRMFHLFGF
jgi:hypothetical protein